jgi:flavin reductase
MTPFSLPESMTLHEPERPPVGSSEFRSAMAAMAATVCVVTAKLGAETAGRTVTSVLSLSIAPPTILVSIDIASQLADMIAKSKAFSFAMLADDQQEVADAFAGRLDLSNRFGAGQWSEWPSGGPMLLGAVTALDCEVIGAIETGTHVLFAGAIVEAETTTSRAPLLWQRHGFHRLQDLD